MRGDTADVLVLAIESLETKTNAQVLFQMLREIRQRGGTVAVDWPDAEGPVQYVFHFTATRPVYSLDGACWVKRGQTGTIQLNYHVHDCCPNAQTDDWREWDEGA
jgi:hypothetical protein